MSAADQDSPVGPPDADAEARVQSYVKQLREIRETHPQRVADYAARLGQFYDLARRAKSTPLRIIRVELILIAILAGSAWLSSGALSWIVAGLAALVAVFSIGHVQYSFGSKWRRMADQLSDAWVPLAAGCSAGQLSLEEAQLLLIQVRHPDADTLTMLAGLKEEWMQTDCHLQWMRDLKPDSTVDLSPLKEARLQRGFDPEALFEAMIHHECPRDQYARFVSWKISRMR